jgi:hypothetical protein
LLPLFRKQFRVPPDKRCQPQRGVRCQPEAAARATPLGLELHFSRRSRRHIVAHSVSCG